MLIDSVEEAQRVAFVTGASKTLGRQIAISLAQAGCALAVGYHEDREGGEATVAAIHGMGQAAYAVRVDITDQASIAAAVTSIEARHGPVSVLVNNAALTERRRLEEITTSDWDRTLAVCLKGVFLCSQIVGLRMLELRRGSIVNIASTAGISPEGRSHHYVAAKAGVIGLTKALALTLAPHVTVNGVAPGYIASVAHDEDDPAFKDSVVSRIPLKRTAHPEEVADLVVFLALRSGYITGQTVVIDGGLTLT
jgi:3-oxoacyl-[acyl-carrier protein] reductase